MTAPYTEGDFEKAIEAYLTDEKRGAARWLSGDPANYDAGLGLASFPFQGLWPFRWWGSPPMVEQIRSVVAPGLIAGAAAMLALIRGVRRVEVWVLLANVVLFVVLLQAGSYADYSAAGRVTTGVVLSREWAESHGCAGFVKKPIEPEALLAEISRCLK